MSVLEATGNAALGVLIGVLTQLLILPLYSIKVSLADNVSMTMLFMLTSVVRNYCVRRFFNWWNAQCNT